MRGMYIIDPNPENIFDTPLIDWAKLMQSLHLGYESLNKVPTCKWKDGAFEMILTRSHAYDELHKFTRRTLANRFGDRHPPRGHLPRGHQLPSPHPLQAPPRTTKRPNLLRLHLHSPPRVPGAVRLMTPTPLRAIMVDLDGTLARTADANLLAYTQALAEAGIPIAAEALAHRIAGRHWREFLPAVIAESPIQPAVPLEPSLIAARKSEIYAANLHLIELNLGLVHLLATCRPHLKTALVTSAARRSVDALLHAHALASLFDIIVTGDDVAHHKPDPEAYQLAAAHLGVLPEETLIYEDSEVGIASAKAFGGHVVQCPLLSKRPTPGPYRSSLFSRNRAKQHVIAERSRRTPEFRPCRCPFSLNPPKPCAPFIAYLR